MVSIVVSKMDMTELIFVVPGMIVKGQYYRSVLLSRQMLPAIKLVASDMFVFQQDNAVSHRAKTISNSYSKKRRTSLVLISGHKTARIWIQWIIRSAVLCSRECMNVVWTVSMRWSCASLTHGTVCSRTLLMQPSMSSLIFVLKRDVKLQLTNCGHQRVEKATESMHACRWTTFWTFIASAWD